MEFPAGKFQAPILKIEVRKVEINVRTEQYKMRNLYVVLLRCLIIIVINLKTFTNDTAISCRGILRVVTFASSCFEV